MDQNSVIDLICSGIISVISIICVEFFAYRKFKKEFNHIKEEFQNSKTIEESQHRQAWLDGFRNDIASYFDIVSIIINFSYIEGRQANINQLYSRHYSILLKLNPENEIDKVIESELEKLTYNLKIFEIYNTNREKLKFEELIKIVSDNNLYFNMKDSIEINNLITTYKAYEKNTATHQNPDGTCVDYLLVDPEILNRDYDEAYNVLITTFNNAMMKELKYHKNLMLLKFRVYLKTEWERIKFLIINKELDFEDKYREILEELLENETNS